MQQASIQSFAVGETTIRQIDGLFSLNDLHKAAGGEAKHQPALFIRLEQTQALANEISSSTDPQSLAIKTVLGKGKAQGTYACRELVIAYAAWINAAFHLKVIRVFLDATAPQHQPAIDYQRISPAQAQLLKEIVHRIVAMGIQTFGETWARLHRKFKVNSYLQLPASRFDEAREYLLGKIPTPPQPAQLESVQTLVAKLAAQIEQGNSYPIQLFEPLIQAYQRRTGQRHAVAGLIPDEQAFDIELRLGRLARLFNPASEPFNDVASIARALGGNLPRLGHS